MAKSTRKTAEVETSSIEEQIRERAYELYQRRGGVDGYDMEDWLAAEQELRGTHADKAAA